MTEHSWQGTWNRPIKVDEGSYDALTIARMTDHNVRGRAEDDQNQARTEAASPIGVVTEIDIIDVVDVIDPDER